MNRSISLLLSFALTSIPGLIPGLAGAQTPSAAEPALRSEPALRPPPRAAEGPDTNTPVRRAQNHFQRGVALYEEQDYDGALAEFARAHELVPNYRVLYNMAQTQVERHDYVDAVRLFAEYLDQGGSEIPPARRQAAERERTSLLERIATVQIESNVGGAELWVDGRSRGAVPSSHALQLNSGMAELRLEKPGYEAMSRELTLVGGDSVVVEMNLEPTSPPARRPRSVDTERVDRPDHDRGSNSGLWLSVGTTALLAGAATTFAVLAARSDSELDRELRQYQEDTGSLDDARSRVRTYAALADTFGAASVVGLGAVLYFALSGSDEEAAPADRAGGVHVWIAGSGLGLRKDF
jgi:tetratricopeptide (TPR) repeat protein